MPTSTLLFRCLVLLVAVALLGLSGCGSSRTTAPADATDAPSKSTASDVPSDPPVVNPRDVPPGRHQLMTPLKVYSSPPGALVFVGFDVVRGDGDALAQTPCEIVLPRGKTSISVEKAGGRRVTQEVEVPESAEVEFNLTSAPNESGTGEPSLLNAPLFEAAVGRPIELKSINSPAKELDPFVAPDGLSIWFASARGGQRGVYSATRPSPYHDFDAPQIVMATSGADMPASPSITGDGLMLLYAVPEKARLWQLVRMETSAEFGGREIVRTDEQAERAWPSALLSSDGVRVYWTEEGDGGLVTRAAVRASKEKLFGKTLKFDLPGQHPHLSSDGMRHFAFDGAKLTRARRGSIKQPFGEPEVVAELKLDNYTVSAPHRQFWVTDDEQWLFYSDDPQSSSDLYVVRLSNGPAWGRVPKGNPIADKVLIAKTEPDETPKPANTNKTSADPRTLPLPYTAHWRALSKLLAEGKGDEAIELVQQSRAKPELSSDRMLLDWDQFAAELVSQFHRDVRLAAKSLKPGQPVRVGGTRFDFVRFDEDEDLLHLKLRDKSVTKRLSELVPGDVVALVESAFDKSGSSKALWYGAYLHFQGKLQEAVASQWLKRAGAEGDQFLERLAARALRQAQQEFARNKITEGIAFLDEAIAVAPASDSGKQAAKDRSTLYGKFEWKMVGRRKWQRGEFGEFAADNERSNGSYLQSDREYGNLEITCEWKVTGPTAMGGVYLRYDGRGNPFENGAKIHLANDLAQKGIDQYSTGSLFGSDAPTLNASQPEGKWNALRIRLRGRNVLVAINGKDILKATLKEDVPASGYVVLDGVAGGISYRKVLVYELPAGE